ncbi:ATPase, T2SS/T4P/T4SS family [Paraburkholderia sp. CNPSo 3281]|nr:ATPase, T2SS/T4P/T4SS family [Paraburkholderia sp. CNPSo 3281]MCP3718515.1 Flp pilus assembly complex ATPase component TadA [Paraburkholderia sp. CNPSo 3281]
MMARLRAWRGSFVEESESAAPVEPAFGATRPVRRGPGAPAGSLGAYLRDADVTDVEAFEKAGEGGAPDLHATAAATPPVVEDVEARSAEPSVVEAVNVAVEATGDAQRGTEEGVRVAVPAEAARAHASDASHVEEGQESGEPPEATDTPEPAAAAGHALAIPDIEYTPVGMPRLNSAQALVDFKRILCDTTPEATLRITPEARREFVAVDMQAGLAVVIATREFHETALYATYLNDLKRVHITVREEMVATAAVIADVYDRARIRVSNHVPEGSRALALFRDVNDAAHGYGSSDVHWESRDYQSDAELRFRVDGDLYTYRRMPKATVLRALSAAYQDLVQSNTNSGNAFQPTAPQSAMIPLALATATLNLRWQSAPQMGGFDVAMRILDGNFRNYTVRMPDTMGIETSQLAIIESLGHVSGGAVLISGETGSAKSTLLRALSYMVDGRELKKQYAVSMPSEYPLPWLSDQSVPRGLDETEEDFRRKVATIIRTLMRMDPDDLTVAEILDSTIAGLVVELALTGHPVRTTIHADSIIGVFMRLLGDRLRLAADEVASDKFINAVGNQKLIPMLCPHCKKPAADVMSPAELELLRTKFGLDTSKMACRNDDGCEHCRKKGLFTRDGKVAGGTKGQTLAMELYRPTPEFLEHIVVRDWRGAEAAWRKERVSGFDSADMTGKTIYEHALYKASQGLIDPRFIDRSMKPFRVYTVLPDRDGRMPS